MGERGRGTLKTIIALFLALILSACVSTQKAEPHQEGWPKDVSTPAPAPVVVNPSTYYRVYVDSVGNVICVETDKELTFNEFRC